MYIYIIGIQSSVLINWVFQRCPLRGVQLYYELIAPSYIQSITLEPRLPTMDLTCILEKNSKALKQIQ